MSKKQNQKITQNDMLSRHKLGSEILIALTIFALGMFFMVPLYSSATAPLQLALLAVFMLAVLAFIVTHYKKLKTQQTHPKLPLVERFVYLSLVAILSVAIVVQVLSKSLDLWLVFALLFVILLKVLLLSRIGRN